MKLKIIFGLIAIFTCVPSFAQEVKIQELLDVESQRAKKNINGEPGQEKGELKITPLPKLDAAIKLMPKAVEPITVAVFGISPNYSGYMNFNGVIVHVKKGNEVNGRIVSDINKDGITLLTLPKKKPQKLKKLPIKKTTKVVSNKGLTKFYPVVSN